MGYRLGVDLGTTFTSAAILRDGRVEIVRLGSRREEIPSVVFLAQDGTVLVGDGAERRGLADPSRLAREFKRRFGDPVSILVGGAPFSAHALTARMLASVLTTVTEQQGAPPDVVTVAHPANWGPYKLELLVQAAHLAGLDSVTLCSEPAAATVNYAAGERLPVGGFVAVYDLGGGTFDAAVLRKRSDGFEVIGRPEGIEQLGGIDFDEAVFDHVMTAVNGSTRALATDDADVIASLSRLRRDCIEAKETLSYDSHTEIPVALPGLHTTVRLNRDELEQMIRPALSDTVSAMHRALRAAALTPNQLHTILLAGGSSRIPLVAEMLGNEFRRPTVLDAHPEQSIAMGAARLPTAQAEVGHGLPPGPVHADPNPAPTEPFGSGQWPADQPASPDDSTRQVNPGEGGTPSDGGPIGPPPAPAGRRSRLWLAVSAAVVVLIVLSLVIVQPWRDSSSVAGQGVTVTTGGDESEAAESTSAAVDVSTTVPDSSSATEPTEPCDFTEDFDEAEIDPSWNQIRQNGDLTIENGSLTITAQDGADIYDDVQGAPMLLRVPTGDFEIETDVTAQPDQFYQGAGLVLWTGPQQYVRLERGFGNVGAIAFEYRDGGGHVKVHSPVSDDPQLVATDAVRVELQLSKTATTVGGRWRPVDDPLWQELGTIEIAMADSTQAGVSALNRAQSGAAPAEFSATFDEIRTTCK